MIWVKCIGIDDKGRVKLSRRAALKERGEIETGVPTVGESAQSTGEGNRYERREDRGPRRDRGDRGDRRGGRGGRERGPRREGEQRSVDYRPDAGGQHQPPPPPSQSQASTDDYEPSR
jgi:polyribonucleotide nucleotidyltransferase